jgi:hypothetical protein
MFLNPRHGERDYGEEIVSERRLGRFCERAGSSAKGSAAARSVVLR